MGVIIRQGIKHSLVNYLGAGIGVLSMLFIYPLHTEAYGLARFLTDATLLFVPITLLGANSLPVRFFPRFADDAGNKGFLGWLLLLALAGSVLTLLLAGIFWERIISYYSGISPLYTSYLIFFLPILILRAVSLLLVSYISNFHRIVVPSILTDLLLKISLPLLILLLFMGWIDYLGLVLGLVANFALSVAGLLAYLWHLGQFSLRVHWPSFQGPVISEIRDYAWYGFAGTISATLAVSLDVFMIGTMISPTATGVYGIASIMANLINRPSAALSLITAPLISEAFAKGQLDEIRGIYRKSAINALVPGLLIFLLIIVNMEEIYAIMPNSEAIASNYQALVILGLGFLLGQASGTSSEIMIYSRLYKVHLTAVMILALSNIALNLFLIPAMGITGAALATMISTLAYSCFKGFIIYRNLQMHPLSRGMIFLSLSGAVTWLVAFYTPMPDNPWIALPLRSMMVTVLFAFLVIRLPVSEELRGLLRDARRRFLPGSTLRS